MGKAYIDLLFDPLWHSHSKWLLILSSCPIILGGHSDDKLTSFDHTKSLINIFHNVEFCSNVARSPWLMMNWASTIICTFCLAWTCTIAPIIVLWKHHYFL
jgi:hypothetical protein